ncbi:hypothetical protein Tco_0445685 [Tanacetum coccineum]
MSRIGMRMLASKGNVPDVRKVDIYFCKLGGLGKQKNLSFIMSVKTRKLQSRSCGRAESTRIRAEALKMLWADSASTTYLIYRTPYVPIGLRIPEEEWRGKDTSLAHLKVIRSRDITFVDLIYEARSATDSSSLTNPIQKSQVVLVDIPENLAENDSIVAEHGGSFKDSGRSNKEDSKDEEFSEEGGSETPQVGDEREVKVLRSFNWPSSELITDDGVLPERVQKGREVALFKGRLFPV